MKGRGAIVELGPVKPKLAVRLIWLTIDLCAVVGAAVLLKLLVQAVMKLTHG